MEVSLRALRQQFFAIRPDEIPDMALSGDSSDGWRHDVYAAERVLLRRSVDKCHLEYVLRREGSRVSLDFMGSVQRGALGGYEEMHQFVFFQRYSDVGGSLRPIRVHDLREHYHVVAVTEIPAAPGWEDEVWAIYSPRCPLSSDIRSLDYVVGWVGDRVQLGLRGWVKTEKCLFYRRNRPGCAPMRLRLVEIPELHEHYSVIPYDELPQGKFGASYDIWAADRKGVLEPHRDPYSGRDPYKPTPRSLDLVLARNGDLIQNCLGDWVPLKVCMFYHQKNQHPADLGGLPT